MARSRCRAITSIARGMRPTTASANFMTRAKRENWGAYEIDSSHNPHVTCPDVLADLLTRIAVTN